MDEDGEEDALVYAILARRANLKERDDSESEEDDDTSSWDD
jgi:hypothetical protein